MARSRRPARLRSRTAWCTTSAAPPARARLQRALQLGASMRRSWRPPLPQRPLLSQPLPQVRRLSGAVLAVPARSLRLLGHDPRCQPASSLCCRQPSVGLEAHQPPASHPSAAGQQMQTLQQRMRGGSDSVPASPPWPSQPCSWCPCRWAAAVLTLPPSCGQQLPRRAQHCLSLPSRQWLLPLQWLAQRPCLEAVGQLWPKCQE